MRGRFVTACTLLAAGALLILLSADWREQIISPGPLAQQHAQLLEASPGLSLKGTGNCAACHAAGERNVAGWTASLVGIHGSGPDQSRRCLECHDKSITTQFALAAHNLPPDELRNLTASRKTSSPVNQIACATCHRDHQGAEFDITAMDNVACQECHQQRFESFATDHPDFGHWPYERPTRIAFNHASHIAKHFAEKKQAFDCRTCHVEDSSGSVQLTVRYEAACAACHDEKIATSVAQGVPIFILPTLDVDVLKKAGHDIGPWPAEATGDFDGQISPMMKLLLAGDPAAAQAMKTLGPELDFFDVDPNDPEHLKAVATLAGAIKKLLAELGSSGPAAMRGRLHASLGRSNLNPELNLLLAGLPVDVVSGALKTWLPDTAVGMLSSRSGVSTLDPESSMPTPPGGEGMAPLRTDPAGAWWRHDESQSIRYRPAAHADPVLAGWLELLATTPTLAQQPLALRMFKELSSPTAPGLCASCHSVEKNAAGQMSINWRAYDRSAAPKSFTKFSHGPHLLVPKLADCTHCHAIDESRSATDANAGWNPEQFVSGFAPASKQQCVNCHTVKAAGNSCQTCHQYHVDVVETWRISGTLHGERNPDLSLEATAQ